MAEIPVEYMNQKPDEEKLSSAWWKIEPDEQFKHVFARVKMLEQRQNYRTLDNIKHARLYSDLEILGIYAGLYSPSATDSVMPNRLSMNVIKSSIDTVTSKIAKDKPRPRFLTEGGDWNLQKKARQLTKFMDGQFDSMGHYETKQDTFRDSGIFGTGFTKFYIDYDRKKICSERVLSEEILVDDAEAIYGTPRTKFQRRLVSKDVLKEMFPKKASLIDGAGHGIQSGAASKNAKDLVRVVEAWHLPSGPNANDGKHFIGLDNVTLEVTDWKFDWFPFTPERWSKAILGYYGQGIARELTGIQIEINKILRNIQMSMHLFAVPRVFVENNSQINTNGLNNDIAAIMRYTGKEPVFHTPNAMSSDVYSHLWQLWSKAFEQVGVSQLSAASAKPSGLDSGAALREYNDIESDRFQIVGQRREATFLADAKIVLELAKVLSKEEGDFKVKVSDQGTMKTIRFSEINMEEEKYMMRVFPSSILPTQPSAKMQAIVEYMQAGVFDKETGMDLMDFPDIEAETNRQVAPRRIVFKTLDKMMESGEYEAPEPMLNLPVAQAFAQQYYLNAKVGEAPEDRLELIRNYITDIVTLLQAQQPQMPPQGPPGAPPGASPQGGDPMAQPEQQPTSDLMPVGA